MSRFYGVVVCWVAFRYTRVFKLDDVEVLKDVEGRLSKFLGWFV